jgi:1-pyrroline-5-carboxylate dehydrogenase
MTGLWEVMEVGMQEPGSVTYVSLESDERIHGEYEAALLEVEREFGERHPMYIGGREVTALREFEARSPIDPGILLGTFPEGGEEHAREGIAAANEAFLGWSRRDWRERIGIVRKTVDAIEERLFSLAALLTFEAGKTRNEALAEVGEAAAMLRYYCDVYEQNNGYIFPMHSPAPGEECRSVMRPYGVWAVISPFNFPIALAAGMIAGALLTGNTVVFKPTSKTPLAGVNLYRLFTENGVPPGALNLVTGPGGPFGEVVAAHPDVAGIAFTGSRAVGTWLYRQVAAVQPYHKPLVAELGSKNPTIVTASADIVKAAEGVARAAFGFAGQKCSATSRVYVHSSVAERFLQVLRDRVDRMEVGDPRRREVAYGPLIDDDARLTFQAAVEEALRDGGRLVAGGAVTEEGLYGRGVYVRPTVIADLAPDHRLFAEELFVPLLLVGTFETLEEALGLANATDYGLTAGIFAEDPEEIRRFFDEIRFGVVYANRRGGATTGAWPGAQPFGGWKASGTTGRGAGGPYYLLSFVREQAQTRVTEQGTKTP